MLRDVHILQSFRRTLILDRAPQGIGAGEQPAAFAHGRHQLRDRAARPVVLEQQRRQPLAAGDQLAPVAADRTLGAARLDDADDVRHFGHGERRSAMQVAERLEHPHLRGRKRPWRHRSGLNVHVVGSPRNSPLTHDAIYHHGGRVQYLESRVFLDGRARPALSLRGRFLRKRP